MINEQTKDILMLEKDPSSYMDESREPSERGTQDQYQRKKIIKKISHLNQSFEEKETQKKIESNSNFRQGWNKNFDKNKVIG